MRCFQRAVGIEGQQKRLPRLIYALRGINALRASASPVDRSSNALDTVIYVSDGEGPGRHVTSSR
jgi:hypothetical protein